MKNEVEKSIILGFIISILVMMTGFVGQCEDISTRVFRLHILANSDSREDQELKLKVRDKLIEYSGNIFDHVHNKGEAELLLNNNLNEIQKVAQQEVYNQGYSYKVKVEMKNMYFNTRHYDEVTLPAGRYDSIRISIGDAKGKNWWCVMFPPMCLPIAEEKQELSEVLNDKQIDIVTNASELEYEVGFKFVEVYEEIIDFVCNAFESIIDYLSDIFESEDL